MHQRSGQATHAVSFAKVVDFRTEAWLPLQIFLLWKVHAPEQIPAPVRDFVILSIGDSVASGEGSPAVQFAAAIHPNQGFWDDPGSDYDFTHLPEAPTLEEAEARRQCHRSGFAGPALAARQVGTTNPVTFMHFASSGATVNSVSGGRSNLIGQLRIARQQLGRIDVLLISGGANNLTFRKRGPLSGFTTVTSAWDSGTLSRDASWVLSVRAIQTLNSGRTWLTASRAILSEPRRTTKDLFAPQPVRYERSRGGCITDGCQTLAQAGLALTPFASMLAERTVSHGSCSIARSTRGQTREGR
jgi:hypothetical protein